MGGDAHGLAAPDQQSAQAQEREHRGDHDDKPDDIDNTVHSSAPSALSVLPQLETPGIMKRFAVRPAVFFQNRGTKTNDPASGRRRHAIILPLHAKVVRLAGYVLQGG